MSQSKTSSPLPAPSPSNLLPEDRSKLIAQLTAFVDQGRSIFVVDDSGKILFSSVQNKQISITPEALLIQAGSPLRAPADLEADQQLETYLSAAAHDLKEPLRKIKTFADRLFDKSQSLLPPESADYLNRIRRASERMHKMVEDLLSLPRLRSNQDYLSDVNLKSVIKQVIDDLDIAQDQQQTAVTIDGDASTITADPLQMYRLILNLVSNALKFRSPNRTPEIKIHLQNTTTSIGEAIELTVSDNGIGFDPAEAERIFVPFQRLNSQNEFPGSGLGLSLCRRIVEQHRGSIRAEGIQGRGAKFIVVLPNSKSSMGPQLKKDSQ